MVFWNKGLDELKKFTLDANCIVAVPQREVAGAAIRALADAHASGKADVAVVAMAASELQKSDKPIENFSEFQGRLADLGLAHVRILRPALYWDIGFWD